MGLRIAGQAAEWPDDDQGDDQDDPVLLDDSDDDQDDDVLVVASPSDPVPNAEVLLDHSFGHEERPLLVCHGGAFHTWDGTSWPEVEQAGLRARIYELFRNADYSNADNKLVPFQPSRRKVEDLLDALRAVAYLPNTVTAPSWLDVDGVAPAREIVAVRNGLLHWPTRTLHPHTPRFYAHHAVPFDYQPDAPEPARWLGFLRDLWPEDEERPATLAELFGYLLSGATDQQKMFLLVGPKRSGKGTIARVATALLGAHNVAGPTLVGLASNFGLSPLIGKPVAIVADARIRTGADVVTERLLAISGEDTLTVDRKYRDPWTGRLPARLVILTNELPRLTDSSGALASRFVTITFDRSFYGQEDTGLTEKLLTELPGILNWSLDGLARLRDRGHFQQPSASAEALREMEDLGSPVGAFVRDRCDVGAQHVVGCDDLYRAWCAWCEENGRDHPGTIQTFARDLRAAVVGLKVEQHRDKDGGRHRDYQGIGLQDHVAHNGAARVPLRAKPVDDPLARAGTRSAPLSATRGSCPACTGTGRVHRGCAA